MLKHTENFVTRYTKNYIDINEGSINTDVNTDYILFTPTYSSHDGSNSVPRLVKKWCCLPNHIHHLKGVVGFGNRYFGNNFCLGARVISKKFKVPLLHTIDEFGTDDDWYLIMKKNEEINV